MDDSDVHVQVTDEDSQMVEVDALSPEEVVAETPIQIVPYCREEHTPYVGMKFPNLDKGVEFYNEYAKYGGFTTRIDSSKVVDEVTTHKTLVCNKKGISKHKGKKKKKSNYKNWMFS